PFVEAQFLVGNDEIEIEADSVAEPLAGRARAERIVEAEQTRLRRSITNVTILAGEGFGISQLRVRFVGQFDDRLAVAFLIANFERINQPRPRVWAHDQAIYEHKGVREV